VRGCLMLAVQADGAEVVTIEGLTDSGEIADLQETFVQRNALQCGVETASPTGADAAGARRGGPAGERAMSLEETLAIELSVNGERVSAVVPVRQHLVDFLRTELGLTGSHIGCEHGVCGACSVRVDGVVVRGCLMLAVQADGAEVVTIEGLTDSGEIADLQETFVQRNALQCGYCTPGMLLTAAELLKLGKPASRENIREFLSGNFCRCTGYHAIVDAVDATLKQRLSR